MSSSHNQRQMAQFQIVTCSLGRGRNTVNPRGDFPLMWQASRIMHHQQCWEIPFNPSLPHSSLHALTCWDAWIPLTICYLSPSMKQASLLRFPGWLTTLQSFELKETSVMIPLVIPPLVIPPRGQDLPSLSLTLPSGIFSCVYQLALVWGLHIGRCSVVSEQQSAASQSRPS